MLRVLKWCGIFSQQGMGKEKWMGQEHFLSEKLGRTIEA
jgi:hypothetical protein